MLTAFLTSNFGWSAAFITPGVSTAAMSVLAYYLICDSPSEIGLEEFTQRTTMKSRTENKTVENRKDYIYYNALQSIFVGFKCRTSTDFFC